MNEQYARSLTWSTVIHGLVFALIFAAGLLAQKCATPEPKVFELVAGEGDNFQATEAPAAQPSTLNTPNRPPPVVRQPTPQPQTPVPPPKQEAKTQPKETPPPKATTMNYSEFLKQNPLTEQKKAPAPRPVPVPKIDPNAAARGGRAPSDAKGAGGTATSVAAGDELAKWYKLLSDRLRASMVKPEGVSDALVAGVQLTVAADGSFTGRVVRSSGNPAFDRAVNEAIRQVSLVGMPPKPDRRAETVTIDFRMVDAPGT